MSENQESGTPKESEAKPLNIKQAPEKKRVARSVGNETSPYLLCTEIMESLKLLNYEKKFQPIPTYYFAFEYRKNPVEQFHKCIEIFSWLLSEHIKLPGFKQPNLYDDPNTVASQILHELKRAGLKMDITPTSLMRASGNPTCTIMHKLSAYCLKKNNIKTNERIMYPEEYMFKEIGMIEDEDGGMDDIPMEEPGIDRTYYSSSDDEEQDFEYIKGGLVVDGGVEDEGEQKVSVEDWLYELEQISPQLQVQLTIDLRNWRTHVDTMSKQEETISQMFADTTKFLQKISSEISSVLERIRNREKMLNSDIAIAKKVRELKKHKEELKIVNEKYQEREKATITLSDELNSINEELSEMRKNNEIKEKELSDISKLTKVKEAIFRIQKEIKEINLRAGVLCHSVLNAKVQTHRAISASRNITSNEVKMKVGVDVEVDVEEEFGENVSNMVEY